MQINLVKAQKEHLEKVTNWTELQNRIETVAWKALSHEVKGREALGEETGEEGGFTGVRTRVYKNKLQGNSYFIARML